MDIRFLTKSRNYLTFVVSEECETIELEGVKYDGELLRFPTKDFDNPKECEAWFKEHFNEFKKVFDPGKTRYKTLHMLKAESSDITDSEWKKIQSMMTRPNQFEKKDVVVYHPLISHNLVDRDIERFYLSVLKGFVKTFPDKSILIGHNQGPPGIGRIFDSKLEKKSVDEALEIVKDMPKKYKNMISTIAEEDGNIYFVRIAFYVLRDDEEFIRKLDAGIIKDMSLGFRATGFQSIKDKDDNVLYWAYTGEGEALEASFVWLGAQYGAQNQKQVKDIPLTEPVNTDEKPPEGEGLEMHAAKEKLDDNANLNNDEVFMKITLKSISLDMEFTEETLPEVQEAVDAKVSEILDGVDELETKSDELDKLKAALGENATPEGVKELIEQANARKTWLIGEVIKYASLVGLVKPEAVEDKKTQLAEMDVGALEEKLKEYKIIHDERNPGKEVLKDTAGDQKKKEIQIIPDSRNELF